jgi:hypothetical protein
MDALVANVLITCPYLRKTLTVDNSNYSIDAWDLLIKIIRENGKSCWKTEISTLPGCAILAFNNVLYIPLGDNLYKTYDPYRFKIDFIEIPSDFVWPWVEFIYPLYDCDNVHDYFNNIFLELLGLSSLHTREIFEGGVKRQFISV